ncbi:tetratricopeptide repeat protein, partial [Frankia sp. CiP3]|uniref:tetratricopeptide repeat protein n=1 Tax=Frankia sp. CiP3 TaxID=2880971 RepID=UPI001EF6F806
SIASHLNNLALILGELGDSLAERTMLERALSIAEATCGVDHPDTVMVRMNLNPIISRRIHEKQ